MSVESSPGGWELDFEVALRVLRRRWWDEVQDLLEQSTPAEIAFDDLELDDDLLELENAIGASKLARFAARALGGADVVPEGDPALKCLESTPERGRAFLRLMGANLAFAIRTDELLAALVASVSGPAPRLTPGAVGGLLARARSARWARTALASLDTPAREAALARVQPSSRSGHGTVVHARTTPEGLGEWIGRVLQSEKLVSIDWGVRKSRDEDSAQERWLVTRAHNGWVTAIARGGVSRERALALSAKAPGLGRVVWIEQKGEAGPASCRFAIFEGGRLTDDDSKLRERVGADLDDDDVAGLLRALGIVAHDPASAAGAQSFAFEDYVAPGRSSSPARLRRQGVTGFAFSPAPAKREPGAPTTGGDAEKSGAKAKPGAARDSRPQHGSPGAGKPSGPKPGAKRGGPTRPAGWPKRSADATPANEPRGENAPGGSRRDRGSGGTPHVPGEPRNSGGAKRRRS